MNNILSDNFHLQIYIHMCYIDGALSNVHCVTQIMFNYELKRKKFCKKISKRVHRIIRNRDTDYRMTNDIFILQIFVRR